MKNLDLSSVSPVSSVVKRHVLSAVVSCLDRGGQVAPGVLEVRPQPERLLKLIDGVIQISLRGERDAQVVVRFDRAGHPLEGGSKLIDRPGELAGFEQDAGQIVTGLTRVRLEVGGTPKLGNRFIQRSARRERVTQVAARPGRIRVEPGRFAKLRDGVIGPARGREGDSKIVVHVD